MTRRLWPPVPAPGCATGESWEDLFFRLLLERIEPPIGRDHPTFLTHWPASQAALARRDPADPRVAERFELFVCGIELANAFVELTDPAEQRPASSPTARGARGPGRARLAARRGFPGGARPWHATSPGSLWASTGWP